MREIHATYQDPLDVIWVHSARSLGIEVERDATVFASWDGAGVLKIGTPETLDPDDSLAQMILHEICHHLIEGPESLTKLDWGLENEPAKRVHEHACLRLQAALTGRFGLRQFLASTTMFRVYYDRLPDDPLAGDEDPAVSLAIDGWKRARQKPWGEVLDAALQATSAIARIVGGFAPAESLWSCVERDDVPAFAGNHAG